MGNRLDGFDIELEFDASGAPRKISYRDGDGCGHEHEFDFDTPLGVVAEYHLGHYWRGHQMKPRKRCPFVLKHPENDKVEFFCVMDPHNNEHHELRTRRLK